jgi:hypothetical protein
LHRLLLACTGKIEGHHPYEQARDVEAARDNGGDLVLNGHMHSMVQYRPLNDQLTAPSSGQPTMIELVNGAGGHSLAGTPTGGSLVEWAKGKTVGTIALTLGGAGGGGTPTRLSWVFEDKAGNPLHSGSRDCS